MMRKTLGALALTGAALSGVVADHFLRAPPTPIYQTYFDSQRLPHGNVLREAKLSNGSIAQEPIPIDQYLRYKNQRIQAPSKDLSDYATPSDPTIHNLAQFLVKDSKTIEEKAQLILDFVNTQLPYPHYEMGENAQHEPPKYSLETLAEGGNCSSKAILGASLMRAAGLRVALISYPEHIAIGVAGNFQGKDSRFYDFEGERYYFAEAAGGPYQRGTKAPQIGEMPDKYFKKANILPIK